MMKRGQQVFPVSNYEDVQKCPPKKTLALWKLIKNIGKQKYLFIKTIKLQLGTIGICDVLP